MDIGARQIARCPMFKTTNNISYGRGRIGLASTFDFIRPG
jgi:hypothetical protein